MRRFLRRATTPVLAVLAIATVVGALALTVGRPVLTGDVTPGIAPPPLPACPHEDALPPGVVACVWDASEQGNRTGRDVVLVVHPHDPVLPPVSIFVRDPAYQPDPRSTLGAVSASNMINTSGLGSGPEEPPLPAVLAPGGPDVPAIAGAGLALVVGGVGTVVATRRRPWFEPTDGAESGPDWTTSERLSADVVSPEAGAADLELPTPLSEHTRRRCRAAVAVATGDHRPLAIRPTHDGRRAVGECMCGATFQSTSSAAVVAAIHRHASDEKRLRSGGLLAR